MSKQPSRILPLAALVLSATIPLTAAERPPEVETVQPGVSLTLVAEHPQLVTPTGIDVDDDGNIWLVASHTHFPPKDYSEPQRDEILRFDPSGKRHVFYRKTRHTMDLELGPNGWVYLAERDRILRIKDTDGDGRADLEQDLARLATDADYPHNGLEGLAWHPDGELLFGLGDNFSKPWQLTGNGENTYKGSGDGGIFRCRPDGTGLRRLARGLWNPFGICVRKDGEIFAVDNDPGERPPCRLLKIVPGGDYGYQRHYGNEAHHPFVCWNGELRGTLPMIHPVAEAPCGLDTLGRGVIAPSWADNSISFYPLERDGASFAAGRIELVRGSRYFRPACIARDEQASDENRIVWYLTDWVDANYQLHGYGRLWRLEIDRSAADWIGPVKLTPPTPQAERAAKLRAKPDSFTTDQLFAAAGHRDPFIASAALSALANRVRQWELAEIQELPASDRPHAVVALRIASMASQSAGNGKLPSDRWAAELLKHESRDVQFETLRWIADARLTNHLPAVERYLERSDIDYRRFESAIAAWNTLSGQPEAGIRNAPMLLKRVRDQDSAARLRAFALRILPPEIVGSKKPDADPKHSAKKLSIQELNELLEVDNPLLSLEVVRKLAANPGVGRQLLVDLATDADQPNQLRAEATAALAGASPDVADTLLDLAADARHRSVRDEALRALRGRDLSSAEQERLHEIGQKSPNAADLVRALLKPESLANHRPSMDDVSAWLKRLEDLPGSADPLAGGRIFHHARVALCSDCHRHQGRGRVVGPDLTRVGTGHDRTWLLEAMLRPSLEMAPQYQPVAVVLTDGHVHTGIRLRSSTREVLRDAKGRNQVFDQSDVEIIRELDKSMMPENLVHTLTDREIRDLIAFLEQR